MGIYLAEESIKDGYENLSMILCNNKTNHLVFQNNGEIKVHLRSSHKHPNTGLCEAISLKFKGGGH